MALDFKFIPKRHREDELDKLVQQVLDVTKELTDKTAELQQASRDILWNNGRAPDWVRNVGALNSITYWAAVIALDSRALISRCELFLSECASGNRLEPDNGPQESIRVDSKSYP